MVSSIRFVGRMGMALGFLGMAFFWGGAVSGGERDEVAVNIDDWVERFDLPADRVLRIPPNTGNARIRDLIGDRTDWLAFSSQSEVSNTNLKRLLACRELRVLELPRLQEFGTRSEAELRALSAACPELRALAATLMMNNDLLTDVIRNCPALEDLRLTGQLRRGDDAEKLWTADGLPVVGEAKRLRHLSLSVDAADNRFVKALLAGCPELETLQLQFIGRRGFENAEDLIELASAPKLTAIKAGLVPDLNDAVIRAWVEKHPDLKVFEINAPKAEVSKEGLALLITGAPALEGLMLPSLEHLDDATLALLVKGCPGLKKLSTLNGENFLDGITKNSALTDDGLLELARLPELEFVALPPGDGITERGVGALAALPKLKWLSLPNVAANDAILEVLAPTPSLEFLCFGRFNGKPESEAPERFTRARPDVNLMFIAELPRFPNHIDRDKSLQLTGHLDDAALKERLAGRTDWQSLTINSMLTDAQFTLLATLPDLREIYLTPWGDPASISEDALKQLAGCAKLQRITVQRGAVTDAVLTAWAEGLPELTSLQIGFGANRLTPEGWRALANAKKLASLTVRYTTIDADEFRTILQSCPNLKDLGLNTLTGLDAEDFALLGEMKKLNVLSLQTDRVIDALPGLLVRNCPDLTAISIDAQDAGDWKFGPEAFMEFLAAPSLLTLSLTVDERVGDDAVAALVQAHPRLQTLNLTGARVSAIGMKAIVQAGSVHTLKIGLEEGTGDEIFGLLATLPLLSNLTLLPPGPTNATTEGVARLADNLNLQLLTLHGVKRLDVATVGALSNTRLRFASFPDADLDDETLLAFTESPNLHQLNLPSATSLTVKGVAKFRATKNAGGRQVYLSAPATQQNENQQADIFAVPLLQLPRDCDDKQFQTLLGDGKQWVRIHSAGGMRDEWMEAIVEKCENLESLSVTYPWPNRNAMTLTSDGIALLENAKKLKQISIAGLREALTDDALAALVRGCPELRTISINQHFGDDATPTPGLGFDALMLLGELKHLQEVNLYIRECDDQLLQMLADNCPDLAGVSFQRVQTDSVRNNGHFGTAGLLALSRLPKLHTVTVPIDGNIGDEVIIALATNCPRLRTLILEGDSEITDAALKALGECPGLTGLSLTTAPEAGDAGFIALVTGKQFYFLVLNGAENLTDAALEPLVDMPNLWQLSLAHAVGVTDAGLEKLAGNNRLGYLDLSAAAGITDKGLLALSKLENLQYINLMAAAEITRKGVDEFNAAKPNCNVRVPANQDRQQIGFSNRILPDVRALGVESRQILRLPADCDDARFERLFNARNDWRAVLSDTVHLTDAWIDRIVEKYPGLVAFYNISSNPAGLTHVGMARLAQLPQLKILGLCTANALRDEDCAAILSGCPELEYFHLCDSGDGILTDEGFSTLRENRALKTLNIRAVKTLTDQTLFALVERNTALEILRIDTVVQFTGDGLAALESAPNLREVILTLPPEAGDEVLIALGRNHPELREINLRGGRKITGAGLRGLADAKALSRLFLYDAAEVTDDGFEALATLPQLTMVSITRSREIGDPALAELAKCPKLTLVSLVNARRVTGAGLAALGSCRELRTLDLSSANGIDDEGIIAFAEQRPVIGELSLNNARQVSDKALDALARCPSLLNLRLNQARNLTPEGIQRFRNQRPNTNFHIPNLPAPGPRAAPNPPVEIDVF